MKTLIIFSLLLTVSSAAYGYYGGGMNSMPMPDQYPNYSQYQQALSLWQQVYGN
jgi:hypothetical protein